MNDSINRQAAVELAMKYCPDDDGTVQCDGEIRELLDELEDLPATQLELDSEALIRTIEMGITAINSNDIYSLGMRNGMRWCKSLIDGVEPKFEDYVTSVDDWKELPSA